VERTRWDTTPVAGAMRPLHSLHAVTPDLDAGEALDLMTSENLTQLPVMSHGHLDGIVTMWYLVRLHQRRRELAS
jgi:CBS domain-containing protein